LRAIKKVKTENCFEQKAVIVVAHEQGVQVGITYLEPLDYDTDTHVMQVNRFEDGAEVCGS
jgi:hypothetical protein